MRTSAITKLPVVTFAGEDVAQVKDIIYAADGGAVGGFTLAGRGLLAGPLKQALAWPDVAALGGDAVMVRHEGVLDPVEQVLEASASGSGGAGGNVLGSRVLTDGGKDLGEVVDVIVEFTTADGEASSSTPGGTPCDVVGYEIKASDSLRASRQGAGTTLLVPLPDTISVSGEHLMVPASAENFVSEDLAGFGAAVADFRAQLGSGS